MEGTIGEIRLFAGNFAPRTWALCTGQDMSIAEYTALFAIVGTTYGGDGQTTFKLPDLQSRIAVGTGQGPGLSNYILGEQVGQESVTLTTAQIPAHTHPATVTQGTGPTTLSATLYGVNGAGGQETPGGNFIGEDNSAGATSYATSGTPVAMHAGSIQNVQLPMPLVTLGGSGGSQPHENIQPILALNYIICLEGIFPSRN